MKLSVTQLADFACREGDLMPDSVVGPTAREGMQAHRKLQKKRQVLVDQADWLQCEVGVSIEYQIDGSTLRLGGRIDLVDTRTPVLSEIKTTLVPSMQLPEAHRALQWAQLYLYGFIFCKQSDVHCEELELELIHVNLLDQIETSEHRNVSDVELDVFAETAMRSYVQWLMKTQAWQQRMVSSTRNLPFPFSQFRQGQRDMSAAIYRACRDASNLICEAPTGIGKTVSSLYPALKSMGEGKFTQLVYLTAKVAGRHSAEQAIQKLSGAGLETTMIQIRAKEQTCFCTNGRCERDAMGRCPMTLGFFDRLPQARDELLALGVIDNNQLDEIAWDHQLCPFELVQQLLPWVQLVVADYNYVFDPLVRLPHFSASGHNALLLIDEAHNLVDRSRWMFSAELSRDQCMSAAHECRENQPLIAVELDRLCRVLRKHGGECEESPHVSQDVPASVGRAVNAVLEQMGAAMTGLAGLRETTSSLWKELCRYRVIADLFSDRHRCITRSWVAGRTRSVVVTLFCLDASDALNATHRLFRASIVFSATLRPGLFYRDTLGLDADTGYMQLTSPFDASKCLRCIVDWVDTRYRHRQESMAALASLINDSTSIQPGNYLVFLPSYAYLEQLHNVFRATFPERDTWAQARDQTRDERQALFENLDIQGHRVGFAIQGGVFGEGIDYKGNRLIGTLIVGTGLPAIDAQSELIAAHYNQLGHNGYDFTYRYPGFTRVLQTAGRVIRDESDCGFVLLVDARFGQMAYRRLFPADWQPAFPTNQATLIKMLKNFWKNSEIA
ncbi:MAG: helicase C-terminal domain-containing protein [Granulosicoccus sp.]